MGERLLCKQEVIGSIPFTSTTGGAKRRRWCVGIAATVTGSARHESERSRDGAVARCLILHHAAIVTGVARHWRRFAPTRVSAAIVEVPDCRRLRPETLFFDR